MTNSLLSCKSKTNLSIDDLYKGLLISGDSGYGKHIIRQNIQEQLIKNGRGLTIIDPSGNNSQKILDKVQSNDIIHIQPKKPNMGFNILNCPVGKSHNKYDYFVTTMASLLTNKLISELNTKENGNIIYTLILTAIKSEEVISIEDFISILESKNKTYSFVQKNNLDKTFIARFKNQDEKLINKIRETIESWIENENVKEFISKTNNNYNIYESIQNNKVLLLDLSSLSPIHDVESRNQISQFFLDRLWVSIQACETVNNGHFLFINQYDSNTYYNIRDVISHSRSYKLGLCISVENMNQLLNKDKHQLYNLNNKITFNTGYDYPCTKSVSKLYDISIDEIQELNRYEFIYYNHNMGSDKIREYIHRT